MERMSRSYNKLVVSLASLPGDHYVRMQAMVDALLAHVLCPNRAVDSNL